MQKRLLRDRDYCLVAEKLTSTTIRRLPNFGQSYVPLPFPDHCPEENEPLRLAVLLTSVHPDAEAPSSKMLAPGRGVSKIAENVPSSCTDRKSTRLNSSHVSE